MVALGLALGASIAWGGSDFLAGLVTRRLPVLTVLVLSQAAGLVLLLILLALAGQRPPPADAVLIAAGAGLAEMAGFAALYRALAIGPMSVVAPLASLAAVVPVAAGLAGGERPEPAVALGLALAVACGALVAFEYDPEERRRGRIAPGAALAAFSALAFGAFFVGTNAASDAGGVAWTVAVNRSTSFAALALAVAIGRKGLTYRSADLRPAAVIGLLDAGANALFALALTRGMTSTVGVIGSLYPVTTVVLATVILRERPRALQAVGVAGVLVGVGLVMACTAG
ncbi:MAG TPA: EamA family transporter [Solirubrobacteraceae bacterium]|nr:EamA family transporter [Solirubrobacteraceae bacterium]